MCKKSTLFIFFFEGFPKRIRFQLYNEAEEQEGKMTKARKPTEVTEERETSQDMHRKPQEISQVTRDNRNQGSKKG